MTKLRYGESHWARESDADKALEQYLTIGERPFNKTKQALLLSLAGDISQEKVLDYGGGAGYMAIPMAQRGARVTIVDAERNGLQTAMHYAQRESLDNQVSAIHSTQVPSELMDASFDTIMAKDIIEHIEDDDQFLSDLAACHKPGGSLILSTQNSFSLNYLIEGSYNKYRVGNKDWCGWDQTHLRFYTTASLGRKLRQAGYRPERWASVYIVPYNIIHWLTLLKWRVELPFLRYIDLSIGRWFPLNRTGWNIIVRARREG